MTELAQHTDQQLLELAKDGNEQAFLEFFNRRADGIYTVVVKIVKDVEVARDLVQDAFITAWLKRAEVSIMEKPALWLLKIASNLSLKYLRRKKLEAAWVAELGREKNQSVRNNTLETGKEVSKLIAEAVDALAPQRKKIYELSREQGLDRRQIAEYLHISEHTVKNQLGAALKSVQQYLVRNGVSLLTVISVSTFFLSGE